MEIAPWVGWARPARARRRAGELMGLEIEIDRLLMKVVETGQLKDVEDALRKTRRQLYTGMVADS